MRLLHWYQEWTGTMLMSTWVGSSGDINQEEDFPTGA